MTDNSSNPPNHGNEWLVELQLGEANRGGENARACDEMWPGAKLALLCPKCHTRCPGTGQEGPITIRAVDDSSGTAPIWIACPQCGALLDGLKVWWHESMLRTLGGLFSRKVNWRTLEAIREHLGTRQEYDDPMIAPSLSDVETDKDTGYPLSFVLDYLVDEYGSVERKRVEVQQVLAIAMNPRRDVPPEGTSIGSQMRFGTFLVQTAAGRCRLIASPHRKPRGALDWAETDWQFVDWDSPTDVIDNWLAGSFDHENAGAIVSGEQSRAVEQAGEDIPDEEQARINAEAYQVLYHFENGLRRLVDQTMSRLAGKKWWDAPDFGALKEGALGLRRRAETFPWAPAPKTSLLSYFTLAELRSVIANRERAFRGVISSLRIFLAKLEELEEIRNNLAHCRPIGRVRLERLKEYVQAIDRAIQSAGAKGTSDSKKDGEAGDDSDE